MVEAVVVISTLISMYLAWAVGVHTLGTNLGVTLGSGILNLRRSVIVAAIFSVAGAVLLSGRIIGTIGKELVTLNLVGLLAVFVSTGVLVTFLAWKRIPISTTFAVVGGIAGFSLISGAQFKLVLFEEILLVLLASPFLAMVLSMLIYNIIKVVKLKKLKKISSRENFERKFFIPGVFSLAVLSFGLGANSIGVVMGALGGTFDFLVLGIIGSIGLLVGVLTWSYKIARTTGIEMADLSPVRGFSVQLAAGITVLLFVSLKIPVSTIQTLIGALIGMSLIQGHVKSRTLWKIGLAWLIVLPAAVILSGFIASLLIGGIM